MESAPRWKSDLPTKSPEPIEKKRESRLTSIIDQLLSNKTKGLKSEETKSTTSTTILNSSSNNNKIDNKQTEQCTPAAAPTTAPAPTPPVAENDSNSDDSGNESRRLESISSRDSGLTSSASSGTCEATSSETSANEETPPFDRSLVNGNCSKKSDHCDVKVQRSRGTPLFTPLVSTSSRKECKSEQIPVVTCSAVRANKKKRSSAGCSRVGGTSSGGVGASGSGTTITGVGGRAPRATESQQQLSELPLASSAHYSAEQLSSPSVGAWSTSNFVQRLNDGAAGCTTAGMPTEGFLVDPTKIKTERLSPSTATNTQNHHQHQLHHQHHHNNHNLQLGLGGLSLGLGGFAFPALGIDTTSPSPGSRRSPASRINSPAGSLSRLAASPKPPPPAFPGSAPHTPPPPQQQHQAGNLHDRFSPSSNSCGTPILKQMEQMMTRNYSDFMRSLAAKYNNNNPAECYNYPQLNGLMRNFDGRFPFKTTTPPLIGPPRDESTRKSENHSAPPVLGSVGALSPLSPLGGVVDLSSTQALLSMVRSASAQSASQLENYLKGVLKRPLEQDGNSNSSSSSNNNNISNNNNNSGSGSCNPRGDPLDLSVPSKRSRTSEDGRKLKSELSSSLKTDSDGSDVSPTMSPRSNGSGSESRAWPGVLLDGKLSALEQQPVVVVRRSGLSSPSSSSASASSPSSHLTKSNAQMALGCVSLCADRACAEGSEADIVAKWTVDDVCEFVASIDACAEYVPSFREQAIDGAALPLLSEDHLTNNMNLKLGPALKFRAILAKKIGHCAVCMHCIHCHGVSSDPNTSPMTSAAENGTKMAEESVS